jgi:hypothetical protein
MVKIQMKNPCWPAEMLGHGNHDVFDLGLGLLAAFAPNAGNGCGSAISRPPAEKSSHMRTIIV